jgi:hypothetical protein
VNLTTAIQPNAGEVAPRKRGRPPGKALGREGLPKPPRQDEVRVAQIVAGFDGVHDRRSRASLIRGLEEDIVVLRAALAEHVARLLALRGK